MILTVIHDQETDLTIAVLVAVSLLAAGLTQGFPDPQYPDDPKKRVAYRETGTAGGGIQVQSSVANGPFVKAAFVAVKFQILQGVGRLVPPPKTNVSSHTVTPVLSDDKYPLGAEATGRARRESAMWRLPDTTYSSGRRSIHRRSRRIDADRLR